MFFRDTNSGVLLLCRWCAKGRQYHPSVGGFIDSSVHFYQAPETRSPPTPTSSSRSSWSTSSTSTMRSSSSPSHAHPSRSQGTRTSSTSHTSAGCQTVSSIILIFCSSIFASKFLIIIFEGNAEGRANFQTFGRPFL